MYGLGGKKRVNLTFINEHCFRMSILFNIWATRNSCFSACTQAIECIQHYFIIHIIRSIIFFSTYSSVKPTHSSIYLASRKNEKCQATFKINSSSGIGLYKTATHMELDHFNYCYLSTNTLNVDERLLSHNPISIIIFSRLTYVSIL